jgi:hypothetical protein
MRIVAGCYPPRAVLTRPVTLGFCIQIPSNKTHVLSLPEFKIAHEIEKRGAGSIGSISQSFAFKLAEKTPKCTVTRYMMVTSHRTAGFFVVVEQLEIGTRIVRVVSLPALCICLPSTS